MSPPCISFVYSGVAYVRKVNKSKGMKDYKGVYRVESDLWEILYNDIHGGLCVYQSEILRE
jgi:hypothetical protein